jgi:arginyl-tRNA synthetase
MIRPLPISQGVGFFSMEQLPKYAFNYREENVGRYWNYHVTPYCQEWPESYDDLQKSVEDAGPYIIDGFSPNLNKNLHVGHLRQLALAKSIYEMLGATKKKFVAILGASQGVYKSATSKLQEWFDFVGYHPEIYYDVLMPKDSDIVVRYKDIVEGSPTFGTELWDGPKGSLIVTRADGRPTYAFADIAFAKTIGPTHYITGVEQQEHFESLGLGNKHLPMGLVMGEDNKKMKSRTGDSVTAEEIISQIMSRLDPTDFPKKLAWNVVAWNFLHVARTKNVKYEPVEWTKPDAPGMYITYAYARIKSALKNADNNYNGFMYHPAHAKLRHYNTDISLGKLPGEDWHTFIIKWSKENPDPKFDLTQSDADLVGFANQHRHFSHRSVIALDPVTLANYTYSLAVKLGMAYHAERIKDGRYGFKYAVHRAVAVLDECMLKLGMFPLEKV